MSELTYSIGIDSSEVRPFIAKMERLIDCARDVFGEDASLDFDIDHDVTVTEGGELVLRPFCKSLEVRR